MKTEAILQELYQFETFLRTLNVTFIVLVRRKSGKKTLTNQHGRSLIQAPKVLGHRLKKVMGCGAEFLSFFF